MPSVVHVNDFHNRANPGITGAVNTLIGQMRPLLQPGEETILACVGEVDLPPPSGTLLRTHRLSSQKLAASWRYSIELGPGLEHTLRKKSASVVHIHGAWMYPQFAAARAAVRARLPIVLTNHGLLSTWALGQPGISGTLKKRLYLSLFSHALFNRVDLYHAITPMDRDSLRALFPGKQIEVIPNSIDTADFDQNLRSPSGQDDEPYLLFCGRLHPQKGVDLLIQAFNSIATPRDFKLVIVGPVEGADYAAHLNKLIESGPKANRIELRDAVWDNAKKFELMRRAWATVVPSRHEVVSLVNLESSACGTPTITTHDTGLFDWQDGGGLLIDATTQSLADALMRCMAWSDMERRQRGEASRRLIDERYSTAATGPRWLELYRALASRGP